MATRFVPSAEEFVFLWIAILVLPLDRTQFGAVLFVVQVQR